tara:strand:+ start:501 stop:932 length:432 start_codon:yes stop_codon:yes gene_type:complete
MKKLFILFLLISCGPQYAKDPNAHTVVTVSYEGGPERIVLPENCKPQLDCSKKTEAECAIALYKASESFIKEGEKLADKKLYLSASIEYMQAMTRLSEAEIRIKRIDEFKQWKIVKDFKLEEKLKKRIKVCEKQIFLLRWKRI